MANPVEGSCHSVSLRAHRCCYSAIPRSRSRIAACAARSVRGELCSFSAPTSAPTGPAAVTLTGPLFSKSLISGCLKRRVQASIWFSNQTLRTRDSWMLQQPASHLSSTGCWPCNLLQWACAALALAFSPGSSAPAFNHCSKPSQQQALGRQFSNFHPWYSVHPTSSACTQFINPGHHDHKAFALWWMLRSHQADSTKRPCRLLCRQMRAAPYAVATESNTKTI